MYFKMPKKKYRIVFFVIGLVFVFFSFSFAKIANASDYVNFNVDKNFEVSEKSQISATLVKTYPNLYFYVEKNWWEAQLPAKQSEILAYIDALSLEFGSTIYPILTSVFGSEWNPGVDGDKRITILFHSMKDGVGGYFRSADEHIKLQTPISNEREMLYLPIAHIDNFPRLKVALAHEFVHLITFNQKDRVHGVQEEVWLNEARADYASTILGYNNIYDSSNLAKRVKDFLEKPSDSLTEWQETKHDYGVVNVFFHYLVDHYGINILADSLKSKLIGIASINELLLKNGYKEDFKQIFTNWTIAMTLNYCSPDLKYCFLNKNLSNLRINPILNFLPLSGNSSLSVTNVTKNWSGNWQKIIGGNGDLKLEFESIPGLDFTVPYIIFDKDNNYSINFIQLDQKEKGEISIKNFGSKYNSLVIMPFLHTKTSGFDGFEFTYPYTFKVSITGAVPEEDQLVIQKLLAQIDYLKKQIATLQAGSSANSFCSLISVNLYIGVKASDQVKCLQQFLKVQDSNIYPEGLITGYFGNLTKAAVIRFQQKYQISSTGFAGVLTRAKINQLLKL